MKLAQKASEAAAAETTREVESLRVALARREEELADATPAVERQLREMEAAARAERDDLRSAVMRLEKEITESRAEVAEVSFGLRHG